DGDPVTFSINWGDGTPATSETTHTFSDTALTHTINFTVTDNSNASTAGTPIVLTLTQLPAFTLLKLAGSFKFVEKPSDSWSIVGKLLGLPTTQVFDTKVF